MSKSEQDTRKLYIAVHPIPHMLPELLRNTERVGLVSAVWLVFLRLPEL